MRIQLIVVGFISFLASLMLTNGCSFNKENTLPKTSSDQSAPSKADTQPQSSSPGKPPAAVLAETIEYSIEGKAVDRQSFEAFKATLSLEDNFTDERIPPLGPGSRGGFGAIWKATGASGLHYRVHQTVLDGREFWSIIEVHSP